MRAAARGRAVLDDLSRRGVELTDGAVAVAGVPDLARWIDQKAVRMRARRKIPFPELVGLGVEARDAVGEHHRDVDVAVRTGGGIAREFRCRHRPLGDLAREVARARRGAGDEERRQQPSRTSHGNLLSKANSKEYGDSTHLINPLPGRGSVRVFLGSLARPARIERATYGFGGHHSIP